MSTKFAPKMKVETADGIGYVKYTKTAAPDFKEIESVCVETDGKEAFFSPDSVKVLEVEEPSPSTEREPKKAKTVKIGISFQRADGTFLPKSEFLTLMASEYDRLIEAAGGSDFEDIAKVVYVAYDEHIGARYNLAYLHSRVVKALQPDGVEEWKKLDKRFKRFFEENTGEGRIFQTKVGKGGGHYRVCDYKEEAKTS